MTERRGGPRAWRRRLLAVAVVTAAASAACGGTSGPAVAPPEVDARSVRPQGVGVLGGSLDVTLALRNLNPFPLLGESVVLGFEAEGMPVGSSSVQRPYRLPTDSVVELVVPVRFEWAGTGEALRRGLAYGELAYRIRGELGVIVEGRRVRVPFTRDGRVTVLQGLGR